MAGTQAGLAAKELVLTRTFDAPRGLVFKAWTDREHLARWWGPRGFTNPVCEADARPGGAIRIDMTGPDGTSYPMTGVFHEVDEPERISFTCYAHPDGSGTPQLEVLNTATFVERDGQTTLTVRSVAVKAGPGTDMALSGMDQGWNESLDRLGDLVTNDRVEGEFILSREFNAPRDMVFRAWTEAEHLARWFGPKGFTMASCTVDLRPGGVFHYGMRWPDGKVMWGKWVYREVTRPERLVHVFSFSDEAGGLTRNPFAPDWPAEILTTTTFAEHNGKTTLTIRSILPGASRAEREAFDVGQVNLRQGWADNFDRLAAHLAQA
jgi:uncharacterized protein YndB with AHSA1/START domain